MVVGISQEEMEGVCIGLFLVERERGGGCWVVMGWGWFGWGLVW